MRIISGEARGRKLFSPTGHSKEIRPTSDRAREALFSILGDRVIHARVLDLYSGTGAIGLEALSRGAKEVLFVDYHQTALELIKKNCAVCLQSMSHTTAGAARIIKSDLQKGIRLWPDNETAGKNQKQYDLIFLDPPYGKGLAEKTLLHIDVSALCTEHTLVIAEEANGITLPDSFANQLVLKNQRRYGDTRFWFYTIQPPISP